MGNLCPLRRGRFFIGVIAAVDNADIKGLHWSTKTGGSTLLAGSALRERRQVDSPVNDVQRGLVDGDMEQSEE